MNIIIAISSSYIEPVKTMLLSLAMSNQGRLCIYLLYKALSSLELQDLVEYVKKSCHGDLFAICVDHSLFSNAPKQKWWSEEMYYRLLAFDILPETVDRALWLDADIIVNGNIAEFYHQSFDDSYVVVCKGCNQKLNKNLGLPDSHMYFNSGVILFNLVRIRTDFICKDVFRLLEAYKDKLKAPDQDILNVCFGDRVKYADEQIYNHEAFGDHVYSKEKMRVIKNRAKIIHFNGPMKPWNPKGVNWADSIWWKYELARGKWKEYIVYRIKNLPVKAYYTGREVYYILKACIARFTK